MSVTVIHSGTFKARKVYNDDAWDFISEWIQDPGYLGAGKKLTFAEKRTLVRFGRWNGQQPHKILPGQLYERQFNNMDGDVYTWRTKKEFFDLACKYDLFPDI